TNSIRQFGVYLTMIIAVSLSANLTNYAQSMKHADSGVTYKSVKIDGLDIFYREAGDKAKPTILLLHGFPTSSHMFRNLIPALADKFHLIAPDYPGFGLSSAPKVNEFNYTFENLTNIVDKFTQVVGIEKYSLYVQDYGAPIGFRLAVKHPERVQALIVQNGNAYEEGLSENAAPLKIYGPKRDPKLTEVIRGFLTLETTKFQYTYGTRNPEKISPDNWLVDQPLLDREGNVDIQLNLFADYYTNVQSYPAWHKYFQTHQPPTLIVWGKNDPFFTVKGVEEGFKKDLKNIEVNYFETGHFALEEDNDAIAAKIHDFFAKQKIK
ncbi:MAG TPA: alpha/beta hydrolase, partial [Pyrinomonadaceae bacterium]|nr:alpha/beta hydrolase [Pyrinomonadaceae bacterium]